IIIVPEDSNSNVQVRLSNLVINGTQYYANGSFSVARASTGVGQDFSLGVGKSVDLSGYTLKMTKASGSKASFVVTASPVAVIPDVKAKLGEKFELMPRQSAYIFKADSNTHFMTFNLEQVIIVDTGIRCFKAPCPSQAYYAIGTASFSDSSNPNVGSATRIKVKMGDSQAFGSSQAIGSYSLSFLAFDSSSKKGTFAVKEISSTHASVLFKLGVAFSLAENQDAYSEEAPVNLELVKAREGIATVNVFNSPKPVDPNQTRAGTTLFLKQGEKGEAFGYTIQNNYIAYPIEGGASQANLTVTQSGSKTTKSVYLDEKFSLAASETATVVRKSSEEQLFRIQLSGISYPPCDQGGKCDDAPVASIGLSSIPVCSDSSCSGAGMETIVKRGDSVQFGNFLVYFVGVEESVEGSNGVFLVKEIPNVHAVLIANLGEKFTLYPNENDTAMINGEGVFIRLANTGTSDSGNAFARIEVWSSGSSGSGGSSGSSTSNTGSSVSSTKKSSVKVTGSVTIPSVPKSQIPSGSYALYANDSIELYGLKITATDIEAFIDNSGKPNASFVATKSDSSVKNVHVGEEFKLAESEAARVLEANMRIDLLSINWLIVTPQTPCTPPTVPTDSNGTTPQPACNTVPPTVPTGPMSATFSVSNYIFNSSDIGKAVSSKVVEGVVSSTASTSAPAVATTGMASVTDLPPTPFETYTLSAGQSVTVNDFTIKLVDFSPGVAYFMVISNVSAQGIKAEFAKGWNLFSIPGLLENAKTDCDTSKWKMFEYDAVGKKFNRISTNMEPGHAYWVYNPSQKCSVKADFRDAVSMESIGDLAKGWNFLPVTVDMIGKTPAEFSENCSFKAAYFFNANSRKWEKTLRRNISWSDLGKGMAVYANEACSLGIGIPMPPNSERVPETAATGQEATQENKETTEGGN
ncbi:MAG: hypothetical protein WC602_05335, partial [archaeon]